MLYDEARELIKDGDLIAIRETKGALARVVNFFTRSPITHTGLAVWVEGGLWVAEITYGRNHLIPLSQLKKYDLDVFHPPIEDRVAIREAITHTLRIRMSYGFRDFLEVGIREWLKLSAIRLKDNKQICTTYCMMIYAMAGWKEDWTVLLSPGALTEKLEPKLQIRLPE